MAYRGDYLAGGTYYFLFNSRAADGTPTAIVASPAPEVSAYKNNSDTQTQAGLTLETNIDGVTGLNRLTVNTSADGTFYSDGSQFTIVISDGTVDAVSVVGAVCAAFSLGVSTADARKIAGDDTAATNAAQGFRALVLGTVASGATTTEIPTNLSEATNDHFNGRYLTFTSGALIGQASDITDYDGASKNLYVTALTEAPNIGDTFVIS